VASQHQSGSGTQPYRLNKFEKERARQIDADNSLLLKKMMHIMNRKQNKEHGVPRVA